MKLNRRGLLTAGAAGLAALAMPSILLAQTRPYKIYMILFRGETEVEKGFREYLSSRKLPVELIIRDVDRDVRKIPQLVAEARALEVDLIYTWGTPVTLAVAGAKNRVDPEQHVTDIPVLFTMVASPEGSGLVDSRTSSRRNLTGAVHVVPTEQQLGAMRSYRKLSKLAAIYNPAEPNSVLIVKELQDAARRDQFQLMEHAVPLDAQGQPVATVLPDMIAGIARLQPQMLYLGPDSFLAANRKVVTEAAVANRLPIFSATEIALREGKALFGLVSRYENVGQLTARKAEQILFKKVRPQDIPIETLTRFSYIVNMTVAAELDFYPPLKVINYAEVIR